MTTILAVSDVVWNSIIGGIVTVVLAYMSYKLGNIAKTGEAVHTLVNSQTGAQLQLNSTVSRRLADITGATSDVNAADAADGLLKDHQAKQAIVDSKPKAP